MKAILLCLCAATLLNGCETDLPPNPDKPTVTIGNNQFREDGNERPATPATDREKNVW